MEIFDWYIQDQIEKEKKEAIELYPISSLVAMLSKQLKEEIDTEILKELKSMVVVEVKTELDKIMLNIFNEATNG